MRNERLAQVIKSADLSVVKVAAAVDVDPKTVERWVTQGRTPRAAHREALAELLDVPSTYLWPDAPVLPAAPVASPIDEGVLGTWSTRRNVPAALWRSLLMTSREHVDVLAFAATFFADQMADLGADLRALADRGVRVRLLLGEPHGQAIAERAAEEGEAGLAGRVELVLQYVSSALGHPGVECRLHDDTLYASLFRFDSEILVNTHAWGRRAADNPVLHLRYNRDGFAGPWIDSFERVWSQARPITAWPERSE